MSYAVHRLQDRLTLWPAAIVAGLTVLALVVPDVLIGPNSSIRDLASFRLIDLGFGLLGLGLLLILSAVKLFRAAVTERFRLALSHAVALVLVIAAFGHFREIADAAQLAKALVYRAHFESCAATAAKYSASGAFGYCSVVERGNFYLSVVHDTDGEVARPRAEWSPAFTAHVDAAVGPLLSECDLDSRPIRAGLYLVRSFCD